MKLDRLTGKTLWKSLEDGGGMGGSAFSSPILATILESPVLLVQTRENLAGLREVRRDTQNAVDFDIPILCYGLRTDFKSHLFEGSMRLMELAELCRVLLTVLHIRLCRDSRASRSARSQIPVCWSGSS